MYRLTQTRELEFFLQMKDYPTATHQQKDVVCATGKPIFIPKDGLKKAKEQITDALIRSKMKPDKPFAGILRLDLTFCFHPKAKHFDGEPHTNKPDRDNLEKTLVDLLVDHGFILKDQEIFSGEIIKIWSRVPGVNICLTEYKGVHV